MAGNTNNPRSGSNNGQTSNYAGCIGCLIPVVIMFIFLIIVPVFSLFDVTGPIPSEMRMFILSFTVGFVVLLVTVISVVAAVRRKSREISRNQSGANQTVPRVKPQPYQIQSNWSRTMQNRPAQSPSASGQAQTRTTQSRSAQSWTAQTRIAQNIYSMTCPHCGAVVQLPRGTTQRCRSCDKPVTAPLYDKPFFS